jgi:cytochrome P450
VDSKKEDNPTYNMPSLHTQMSLGALSGVALVLLTLLRFLLAGLTNPRRHVPGPWWAKFTSLPMNYHRWRGDKFRWVLPLHQRYGPVILVAPNEISVGSLEGLQTVHKMGTGFTKGAFHVNFRIGPAPSLFDMTDTKAHAERRRLFSRAFTAQSLRQNWQPEVRRLVEKAVARIKEDAAAADAEGTADVAKWWKFMASDVVSRLSFGQAFNMLDGLDKADMRFWAALRTLGQTILLRQYVSVETIDTLARVLPLAWLKRVAAAKQAIYDQGSIAVENMRRKKDSDKRNIFYKIVEEADHKEASGLTDDAVRSEAATFMIGGAETTSAALTYLTWAIARRPGLQARIEAEVAGLRPDFTDEDVEALPLLGAVVTEALRMYNPAPGANARICPPGGATVDGIYIPGGSVTCTVAYAVHRIPDIFPNGDE